MNKLIKQTNMTKTAVCLIAGCFIAIASTNVHAEVVDVIEKSFNVEPTSKFSLENVNGRVDIEGWQEPLIKVTATITADDQDDRDKVSIIMKQSGNNVRVETHYKNQSRMNRNSGKVTYQVFVPMDVNLSHISVVNGALTIENVQGEVNAEVVNGSVKAKGLAKNSEINSVNGSIKVFYDTIATDLDDIDLATVNGSIKLYLPSDISASLDIETMHGSIKTDFGLSAEKNMFTGRSLQGDIGSGDVKITMESVNGSIKVLKK